MKSHAGKKNEYIYAAINREELEENTRINFEVLQEAGIMAGVNWSTVRMVDQAFLAGNRSDKRIYKGILMLEDDKNQELKIYFDVIKINNSWYLFQGIKMEK